MEKKEYTRAIKAKLEELKVKYRIPNLNVDVALSLGLEGVEELSMLANKLINYDNEKLAEAEPLLYVIECGYIAVKCDTMVSKKNHDVSAAYLKLENNSSRKEALMELLPNSSNIKGMSLKETKNILTCINTLFALRCSKLTNAA